MTTQLSPSRIIALGESSVPAEQLRCGSAWTVGWSKKRMMLYYSAEQHIEVDGQDVKVEVWAKDGPPQRDELSDPRAVWHRVHGKRRQSSNCASQTPTQQRPSLPSSAAFSSSTSSSSPSTSSSGAATVHADYLGTLAQSHSDFLFGGFAELLHNAVDSGATDVRIEVVERSKGKFASDTLEVRDNGCGMSRAELERMMRFGKERQVSGEDVAGKYGIGFKSGTARLSHYATVVTRRLPLSGRQSQTTAASTSDESSLYFVSLLNPNCADSEGNLLAPLMVIDADTAKVVDDASRRAQLLIQQHTEVDPVRWVMTFAHPDNRTHGTSIYLQSLKGERSARALDNAAADEIEWLILAEQHDIQHARGVKFQRTREAQQLAEIIRMDFSLRAYMEVMYLRVPSTVRFTLLGKQVDTCSLLEGAHEFQRHHTYALLPPQHITVAGRADTDTATSVLHMGYSAELHRDALCGVHIYWHNILIESFLHVGYDRVSSDDHGFLGLLELRDDWGIHPLNHKQGFPKSSPRYALLKERVADVWRRHVAQRRKEESQATPEHAALEAALLRVKEAAPGKARDEAAVSAWMLYQTFQVQRWANDYEDAELRRAAASSTHLELAELLVRRQVLPPSLRQMQRFIATMDENNLFLQCDKCNLARRVSATVAQRFSKGSWTCAMSPELLLLCGRARPEDCMDEDEAVVQERQEGVSLAGGGFEREVPSNASQLSRNQPSLLDVPSSEFVIHRDQPLGSGNHSTVFMAAWRGVDVAVKVLRSDCKASRALIASFKDEVRVLAALQHPLLIRMLFYNKEQLAIGLEYLPDFTPLPTLLLQPNHAETDEPLLESVIKVLLDVATGISFMHSRDCLHRDLCPANVLLRSSDWSVKILDFGLATWLRKEQRAQATRERTGQPDVGTATYKAPERFRSEPLSKASDVFSFGVMAWELLARQSQPWATFKPKDGELSYDVIQRAITTGKRPSMQPLIAAHCPSALLSLVQRCWHDDLSKRPVMDDVVRELQAALHSLLHGLDAFRRRHQDSAVVYRVLHREDEERLAKGLPLQAADPQSSVSLERHVRFGSMLHSPPSSFMSTTLSFSWALHYAASLLHRPRCLSCSRASTVGPEDTGRPHAIVAIALDGLSPAAWSAVFDLSNERLATAHGLAYPAHSYAVDSQEVLLSMPISPALVRERYRVLPEHVSSTDEGVVDPRFLQLPRVWNDSKRVAIKWKVWLRHFNRAFEPSTAALKRRLEDNSQQSVPEVAASSLRPANPLPVVSLSDGSAFSSSSSSTVSKRTVSARASSPSVSSRPKINKGAGARKRQRPLGGNDSDSDYQPEDDEPLLGQHKVKKQNGRGSLKP